MSIEQDIERLLVTVHDLFRHNGAIPESEVLSSATVSIEQTGYDNWNGGIKIFSIYLDVPLEIYVKYEREMKGIENAIQARLEPLLRKYPDAWIGGVVVTPQLVDSLHATESASFQVTSQDLLAALESQKNLLIAVSTGGPRIQSVNAEFKERQRVIEAGLEERRIDNPIPYADLWDWYGKWSSGDLPSYQSRRSYISGLLNPLIKQLRSSADTNDGQIFARPTGWSRVDRSIGEIRTRLGQARAEEQFQAVGLLCRDTIISLAEAVYEPGNHPSPDGVEPSKADAKRMLEGFLTAELPGEHNKIARKHAKAALDLANELTHRRTATFRDAAMCAEATTAVVNIVAIVSGQRDPEWQE